MTNYFLFNNLISDIPSKYIKINKIHFDFAILACRINNKRIEKRNAKRIYRS
jgi:hypothetical protein